MARVSALNGLTVPELIEYASGTSRRSGITRIDYQISRPLLVGLAQVCRVPQDLLAEIDLCAQLPNAPVWLFLPDVHEVPNDDKRSPVSIPSCPACFVEHERNGSPPYWKAVWALALIPICPKHLLFLSPFCSHCLRRTLSVVAHPKHNGLVVRCTACFRAPAYHHLNDPEGPTPRTQLVASMAQALVSACQGLDPDPTWLGPVNAATFLSVIDDLVWIFMDGDLHEGFPLIAAHAPSTHFQMVEMGRRAWRLPPDFLSAWHREILVAAIALTLLGRRMIDRFDPHTQSLMPISEFDSYPFSSIRAWTIRQRRDEIMERIARWPTTLKKRALLALTS